MEKNLIRTIIVAVTFIMLIGCCLPSPVIAEEAVEDETTDEYVTSTETKDLDDMTIEELKIAYLELQLENEKLKNELNSLQQRTTETETEAMVEELEVETEDEPVLMSVEEFENDIVDSYNGRNIIANRYTTAELNSMTSQEIVEYRYEVVSTETDFYNK